MSAELDLQALAEEIAGLISKPTPPLLDADQAAELLHVPASWIRAEARAGRIPNVRLGKYVRFRAAELEAWIDGRHVGPRTNGNTQGAR